MIRSLLLCSMLVLGLSTSLWAETTYYVKGETFRNVDNTGFEVPVTGLLIGDDDAETLTGSIFVDHPDFSSGQVFPFDGFLLASSVALAPFGVPAQATVGSPDSASPDGLTGVALNFVDFERSTLDPFTFETLTGWESLIAYFGVGPGQDGERYGAVLQLSETPFHDVPNPSTWALGIMAAFAFVGYGCFVSINPK